MQTGQANNKPQWLLASKWSHQVAALTQNQHTELVAIQFGGTYNDHVGGQALLMVRTLTERTEWLWDPLSQRVMGNHYLDGTPWDAGFQSSQPGQLGRGDGRTPGAAHHGLQHYLLQLLPQRNLLWACKRNLNHRRVISWINVRFSHNPSHEEFTEHYSLHIRNTAKSETCHVSSTPLPCIWYLTSNMSLKSPLTVRLFLYVWVCPLPKRARYCKVSRIIVSTQRSWLLLRPNLSRVFSVSWLLL